MSLKNKIVIKSYSYQNNNELRYPPGLNVIDKRWNQKDLYNIQHFPEPESKYRQAEKQIKYPYGNHVYFQKQYAVFVFLQYICTIEQQKERKNKLKQDGQIKFIDGMFKS